MRRPGATRAPSVTALEALLAEYVPQPRAALGWTNTVQCFAGPSGARFLRTPRSSAPAPGVAWQREAFLLKQAVDLAPAVLYDDPETGLLLTEGAPGRPLSEHDLTHPEIAAGLGQALRRLHALPHHGDAPFHPAAYALTCLKRATAQGATVAASWLALAEKERTLPLRTDRLTHNDLHGGNLLMNGARLTVLDWELAAPGDPIFDLVTLCCHLALPEKTRRALFNAYGACLPQGADWARLARLHWLREFSWACWAETEGIGEAREQRQSAEQALRREGGGAP